MCGRFSLDITKPDIMRRFRVAQTTVRLASHFNVCPGMMLPIILRRPDAELTLMKWGLIPSWSKIPSVKFSTINARAENLGTSPVYRTPFRRQRCLVPATGFYEWKQEEDGIKWPYYFSLDTGVFSFAGIWDVWRDAEGKEFPSCAIVTCPANAVVGKIHPRMPVILEVKDEETWLKPEEKTDILRTLLCPYNENDMSAYRVSRDVNNPANDTKTLIYPYTKV